MPSVSSISGYLAQSVSLSMERGISQDTINKLLALGIDVTSVRTETEAKRIIAEKTENKDTKDVEKKSNVSAKEEKLLNNIKTLARQLGIKVDDNDKIEHIFTLVENRIDDFTENGYSAGMNVFQSELERLKTLFKNLFANDSGILSAMDMMSRVNSSSFISK